MRPYTYLPFLLCLMDVENASREGWHEEKEMWFPVESLEGGTPTIGYGHKITPEEAESGTISVEGTSFTYQHGLSDLTVLRLFQQDVKAAEKRVSKEWTIGGIAPGASMTDNVDPLFERLPLKYQGALVNVAFNVGTLLKDTNKGGRWGWPKLRKGILADDDSQVFEEMLTWYRDRKGKKRALRRRRDKVAHVLGLHYRVTQT